MKLTDIRILSWGVCCKADTGIAKMISAEY